jgi:hypothetical protein
VTVRSPGHTVFGLGGQQMAYTSVREASPAPERSDTRIGRALRREVPRKSLGIWRPCG